MKGVSVVVCCYNSECRLPVTLSYLAKQRTTYQWEIVIVDNASTDNTASVAVSEWKKHGISHVELVVVSEGRSGLNFAREKGLATVQYDTAILCDDDNYLDENYVQHACKILDANPLAGIVGGLIIGAYEVNPPCWFSEFSHLLAIGDQAEQEGDITSYPGIIYGAGMVIRKSFYEEIKASGFNPVLSDRKKGSLSSGGDTELCFAFRLAGYQIFYSRQLKLTHYMTAPRLTWPYLKMLKYYMGRSSIYFISYYEHLRPDYAKVPRGWKKRWWYQYFSTMKEVILRSPQFIIARYTGDKGVLLDYYFLIGRMAEVMMLRSGIYKSYERVDAYVAALMDIRREGNN